MKYRWDNDKKNDNQLLAELRSDYWLHRFWTATWIVRQHSHHLNKKAIQALLAIFDSGGSYETLSDIAHDLGAYNPDDEYIMRQLVRRNTEGNHHIWWGIQNAVQSKQGAKILLYMLNDPNPHIRKGTHQFFLYSDYEGAEISQQYIDLDMMADFEQAIIYPEAQEYLEHWLAFYPR